MCSCGTSQARSASQASAGSTHVQELSKPQVPSHRRSLTCTPLLLGSAQIFYTHAVAAIIVYDITARSVTFVKRGLGFPLLQCCAVQSVPALTVRGCGWLCVRCCGVQ